MGRSLPLTITILLATAGLALSQEAPFPPRSLDYMGFATWNEVGEMSHAERSGYKSLLASDALTAKAKFESVLNQGPERPLAILGLAQARRLRLEMIPALTADGKRFEEHLAHRRDIPQSLLLSYGLNWAFELRRLMAKWEAGGKAPPKIDYSASYLKWRGEILQRLGDVRSRDRRYSLIQASILMALNYRKAARAVASAALKQDDEFYQMRLLYAVMLNGGSVMRTRGGKQIPVPADERPYPDRARDEAIRVTKQAPRWAVGWYVAGSFLHGSDKAKSRQYLQHYLSMNPPDSERVKKARDLLAKG